MMRAQSRRPEQNDWVTAKRHWRTVWPAIALVAGCANSPLGCSSRESDSPAQGPFPRQTVAGSEVRVLPRSANGRRYQLYVGLPDSYEESYNRGVRFAFSPRAPQDSFP